jgi:hydroxyacylglutathione hydrolase
MQITNQTHAIKIPFKVPVSPELSVDRFAFVYLIFGDKIHLIDSGVAGAGSIIWQYIREQGRAPNDISNLLLTHSHPDHIGAAKSIKDQTGCTIIAHKNEQNWIEDTEQQLRERPVPGFQTLVEGSVKVDHLVVGGELLELEKDIICKTIHTPGHSKGSISLWCEGEHSLFTADALPYPDDLPIYEDISACLSSIKSLQLIKNVENLFSSWESPIQGQEKIGKRMAESIAYLERIHNTVISSSIDGGQQDIMELCKKVVSDLGLPPFAVNPLVARAFASSLAVEQNQ